MICGIEFVDTVVEKGVNESSLWCSRLSSGIPDTAQRNRNNIPDFMRTVSVNSSVKDEKICDQTTARKR